MTYKPFTHIVQTPIGELSIVLLDGNTVTIDGNLEWQYNNYMFHCRLFRQQKTLEWKVINLSVTNDSFMSVKPVISNGLMSSVRVEWDKFVNINPRRLLDAEIAYRSQQSLCLDEELIDAKNKLADLEARTQTAKEKLNKAYAALLSFGGNRCYIEVGLKGQTLSANEQFDLLESRLANSAYTLSMSEGAIVVSGGMCDFNTLEEELHWYFEHYHPDIWVFITT